MINIVTGRCGGISLSHKTAAEGAKNGRKTSVAPRLWVNIYIINTF